MATLGSFAKELRAYGERRVARLQKQLATGQGTKRTREWMRNQIKEIKSAIQGTRQYSKTGKRYKSKTQGYIAKQMTRLAKAVSEVAPKYTVSGDSFEVTQRELNRASVNAPSVYTKTEAKLFYRVTQKIWQREGVGEHDRNETILNYYNSIRRENGLSPMRLDEIVDYVLNANQRAKQLQFVSPSEPMDLEAEEFYKQAGAIDNADMEAGSPPGISQMVVNAIQDALEDLFVVPEPTLANVEG